MLMKLTTPLLFGDSFMAPYVAMVRIAQYQRLTIVFNGPHLAVLSRHNLPFPKGPEKVIIVSKRSAKVQQYDLKLQDNRHKSKMKMASKIFDQNCHLQIQAMRLCKIKSLSLSLASPIYVAQQLFLIRLIWATQRQSRAILRSKIENVQPFKVNLVSLHCLAIAMCPFLPEKKPLSSSWQNDKRRQVQQKSEIMPDNNIYNV